MPSSTRNHVSIFSWRPPVNLKRTARDLPASTTHSPSPRSWNLTISATKQRKFWTSYARISAIITTNWRTQPPNHGVEWWRTKGDRLLLRLWLWTLLQNMRMRNFLFFSFLFTKQHEAWRRRKRRRRRWCDCRSFVSLKDVGFDLAKGLMGLRRVGFTFLGG